MFAWIHIQRGVHGSELVFSDLVNTRVLSLFGGGVRSNIRYVILLLRRLCVKDVDIILTAMNPTFTVCQMKMPALN